MVREFEGSVVVSFGMNAWLLVNTRVWGVSSGGAIHGGGNLAVVVVLCTSV